MRKGWKKKEKYSFWLQKDVKIENQYDFWNLWTLIISKFWQSLSHQIHFEGSSVKSIFFFSVLYRKAEKQKNTIFCYKKGSKSKTKIILKIFGRWLYKCFGILYRTKSILKGLAPKAYFSLAFYAERLENSKIQFLVTKRGQNQKSRWFLKSLDVNYIKVLSLFFAPDRFWRI